MKTSKVAQDTARLISALSSRRSTRSNGAPSYEDVNASLSNAEDVDGAAETSSLSSAPSDAEEDTVGSPHKSRKRKRAPATTIVTVKTSSSPAAPRPSRVSPKKAVSTLPSEFPRKARRQPAKHVKSLTENGEPLVRVEAPPNWGEIYRLTQEMRSLWPAPVDTMGCESLAEEKREPKVKRFQTLVALMLSSQTKDTVTAVAMRNLQEGLPGGFTLSSILAVSPDVLNDLISKVGFHNTKTKHIKAAAQILVDRFGGDIPSTIEGLVSLPGVGPKMAYLTMSAAWGRDEGIGVDVHVHRITNLWGWHKTKTPEETRAALEAWLPKEKWHDINGLLVGFGQTWCPPVGRKCGECRLAEGGLCPSAVVERTIKKVKKEKVVKDEEGSLVVQKEEEKQVKLEPVNEDVTSGIAITEEVLPPPDIEDIGAPRLTRASSRRTSGMI